jgi:hypothetical protein
MINDSALKIGNLQFLPKKKVRTDKRAFNHMLDRFNLVNLIYGISNNFFTHIMNN